MPRLIKICPHCGLTANEVSHEQIFSARFIKLDCGHLIAEDQLVASAEQPADIRSADGFALRHYQVESCERFLAANGRILFAHEMGLGKTPIALSLLRLHAKKLLPALIICKSSLLYQWQKETVRWIGQDYFPQILSSGSDTPFKMFKIYITSFDLVGAMLPAFDAAGIKLQTVVIDECQMIKNQDAKRTKAVQNLVAGNLIKERIFKPTLEERKRVEMIANDLLAYHGLKGRFKLSFEDIGPRKLGLCECHASKDGIIKGQITINLEHAMHADESEVIETILHEIAHAITPGAGHKKIWSDTSLAIGGNGLAVASCEGSTEYKGEIESPKYLIALSGTPIKNNASEYFPILNLLRPELFPSYAGFCHSWLETYRGYKGKQNVAGLKRWRVNEFHETTAEFIFRKTRAEAAPELPTINRQFVFYNVGENVRKAYLKTAAELDDFMSSIDDERAGQNYQHILAFLNRMRYLTGMAKVEPVVEYVEEFLENNPDKKLTIFHHHHDVGRLLEIRLAKLDGLIRISENDTAESRDRKINLFTSKAEHRLLIARTIAEGEGLNLQACSNAVIMERQWNPANEAQAEARFARIGSQAKQIDVVYPTATDTIDEYFAELVEKKRAMMAEVLDNEVNKWSESNLIIELANIVRAQGRKMWSVS